MNICFVILSNEWGGAETVVYELARQLTDKGESVSIILNEETVGNYEDLENVRLFNIGPLYPPRSIIPRPRNVKNRSNLFYRSLLFPHIYLDELLRSIYYRKIRKDIIQFLRNSNIDIICPILEDSVPLVSDMANDLKILNISTVTMIAGEHNLRGLEPIHPLALPLVRWKASKFKKALRKADIVVGPSLFIFDAWEKQGVPLHNKYVVIPNGVHISEIQKKQTSILNLKGGFKILFPGGSKFIKGGDLLIKSLTTVKREIPDIHIYIAWDVPLNHKLRRMVTDLGLEQNVTFTGFLPKKEYFNLLNYIDLLVMPSREEAFGIVYVEAMALGKPIIAANTGGSPEVIKDGRNGIIVGLHPEQVAQAIITLYENEDLRKQISQNNLTDVDMFDWFSISDRYLELYGRILKESS